MKHLLIALIALTMTLGVACKKETITYHEEYKLLNPAKLQSTEADNDSRPGKHWADCTVAMCQGCKLPK